MGAQRAWWAVSGSKKNPKRQPKGAVPMEIDSISEGPKPGRCAGTALPGPALTGPEAPPGILKNRRKEAEYEIEAPGAQNPLSGTPFSFLFRGFVSDFSVSGPSEAPVFRDETPEVHDVSLGEPSLLRKEHELEVVEHDCAHEFSEVCSGFEFFPERPSWQPSSCWCGPDAERVGGRFAEASVSERARGPPTGGRGFGPAPSGGGKRAVASFIPLLRTPEPFADVHLLCALRTEASSPEWPWVVVAVRETSWVEPGSVAEIGSPGQRNMGRKHLMFLRDLLGFQRRSRSSVLSRNCL